MVKLWLRLQLWFTEREIEATELELDELRDYRGRIISRLADIEENHGH